VVGAIVVVATVVVGGETAAAIDGTHSSVLWTNVTAPTPNAFSSYSVGVVIFVAEGIVKQTASFEALTSVVHRVFAPIGMELGRHSRFVHRPLL